MSSVRIPPSISITCSIAEYAQSENVDFMVIGTRGERSNIERIVLGNNEERINLKTVWYVSYECAYIKI